MSGCEPTLSTVKFYEFGNIGDGAIEESINGCTVFTDEADANAFEDYTKATNKLLEFNYVNNFFAISNPSLESQRVCSRALVSSLSVSEIRKQYDFSLPRPTRPRS